MRGRISRVDIFEFLPTSQHEKALVVFFCSNREWSGGLAKLVVLDKAPVLFWGPGFLKDGRLDQLNKSERCCGMFTNFLAYVIATLQSTVIDEGMDTTLLQ